VAAAWERIENAVAETAGNLLVVTHGLVCRVLVERHLNLLPGESPPRLWANAALTEVEAVPPWKVPNELWLIWQLSANKWFQPTVLGSSLARG
jgi:broad specificity phosphatase PhoE